MRKAFLTLLAGAICGVSTAQTIFTYGGMPVSKEEFVRVYQKNSVNKETDFSKAALKEYLDLYSLFKMKVKEAELIQLDTVTSVALELDNYRRQLSRNYMTDKQVTEKLVREAYDRGKTEVRVQHILVSVPQGASPVDTMKYYRRADSIYTELTRNKKDFGKMAKAMTDDKGTRDAEGDIGYMTALQTIYPFENAVYNTKVGDISRPFRTQFGYHVIKVTENRPSRGSIQVAQILVTIPKANGEQGVTDAKAKMKKIQAELKKGASFEDMVVKYSDDKFTKEKGGVLDGFSGGRYDPAFENAAFSLKKPGDISEPIQTEFGFHLLKLVQKFPPLSFDSAKDGLMARVSADSRAAVAREEYMDGVKKRANFKEYPEALKAIEKRILALPDTGAEAGVFSPKTFAGLNAPVFSIAGKNFTQKDYGDFMMLLTRGRIMGPRGSVTNDIYKMFVDRTLNDYQEQNLAKENPEFRNLMEEYRNGILLFELMDRNVWTKASVDSVGLKAFYERNKGKYKWEPGFEGTVYKFKSEGAMIKGMPMLTGKMMKDEAFMEKMNSSASPDEVSVTKGHFEYSKFPQLQSADIIRSGYSKPIRGDEGSYMVVFAKEKFADPTIKTLDEARGYVVAEYQDFLEKAWNQSLRNKYPVKVEEAVFNGLVK